MTNLAGDPCHRDDDRALCRELDQLLFHPDGWFALSARNTRIRDVPVATLDSGLALVGRGRVASIVGRLHPEIAGIDIDAGGESGQIAADALTLWCRTSHLWHLLRPSGGAPGRFHLFVVPGVHDTALDLQVDVVRRDLGLRATDLSIRTHFRPLSAPHRLRRRGVAAPADLEQALASLQQAREALPERILARRAERSTAAAAGTGRSFGGPAEPLTPLPRPRRELPEPWAAYLAHGRAAAASVDRSPSTRSQLELEATSQLVIAGLDEPAAWAAISGAHPGAFPKAREKGRRWWWYVWNRCVLDADEWLRAHRSASPPSSPLESTRRARHEVEALWRSWPPRTRHTLRELILVVLARMDRVGSDSVAIPQRDLVLDSAIASRTTVRALLDRLVAADIVEVEKTYQPKTTNTADTIRLAKRFREPPSTDPSLTDPSKFQPPQPARRPPLLLRRSLGLAACTLVEYLPDNSHRTGLSPSQLAQLAGLLDPGQEAPSPRQLRTVRAHLKVLAGEGLTDVDEHGLWRAGTNQSGSVPTQQRGQAQDTAVRRRIASERADFRAALDPAARRAKWVAQREEVLSRQARAARVRQRAWWVSQPAALRAQRSNVLASAFSALPANDQARRKHELAEQRARAGEDERIRYDTWRASLSPIELDERSVSRAHAYTKLPDPVRAQLITDWTAHRARWRLPHPRKPALVKTAPEKRLLKRAVPEIEQLVLLDQELSASTAPDLVVSRIA